MTMVGCSSSVVPFLQEVSATFQRRSPAVRAKLDLTSGLLEEDLVEVDDALTNLIDDYSRGGMSIS